MASIEQLRIKTVGQVSKATITEDDDKWTDLAENFNTENRPAQIPMSDPLEFLGPFPPPQPFGLPPPHPFAIGGQPSPQKNQAYFHPPGFTVYDIYGRPLPSEQVVLEAQLAHLGEVTLGLTTAVGILEAHLIPDGSVVKEREITFQHQQHYVSPRDIHGRVLSSERMTSSQALRDMGYLIGLKRAVKILQEAAADENLQRVTYKVVVQPPLPQQPPPMMQLPGMGLPQFPPALQHAEFKTLAKDIVKDTVREYKEEIGKSGSDEVQKEMIKLCRSALTRPSE